MEGVPAVALRLLVGMHGEGRGRERVVGVGIFGGACAGSWGGKGAVGTGMVLHFVARCLQGSGKHGEGGKRKSGRSGCLWRYVLGGKLGWEGAFVWWGSGRRGGSLHRLAGLREARGRERIDPSGFWGGVPSVGVWVGSPLAQWGGGTWARPSLHVHLQRQRQRGGGRSGFVVGAQLLGAAAVDRSDW